MAAHDYHVITRWTVDGTIEEVADVFRHTAALPCWWPAVFLEAEIVRPGGADSMGQLARLRTKGWLPYTLRFHCTVTSATYPRRFVLTVAGDFDGRCICRTRQRGRSVDLVFDWKVRVNKPLVRRLSPLLKPIFVANHRWVMRRGRESLLIELARRRAERRGDHVWLIRPPGPTFPHSPAIRLFADRVRLIHHMTGRRTRARLARGDALFESPVRERAEARRP